MVSPILTGDTNKSSLSIKKICYILEKCQQEISSRCGGHIHIGKDYLTTSKSWNNFTELWGNAEKIFYIISNKEGEIPRDGILKYAIPISGNFEEVLNTGKIQLDSVENANKFAKEAQHGSRYFGINYENRDTFEFRLPNGTIDANTWIENINLFGGIIMISEKLAEIEAKEEKELTEEEKEKLICFQKIKNPEIMQEEKAEAVIELIISEKDRDIYRKRYQVNSKLIEENPRMKEELEAKVARKPITIKDVRKKIFTGEKAVNGVDYIKMAQEIERNLQKQEQIQENNSQR